MDLLGRARPRDEEHDAQALTAAVHGEDLGHPRADPLEVLGCLDNPDQHDLACRGSAVGVADDKVTHVGHGLRDADATSEEHDGTVRVHVVATIRTLNEALGHHAAIGASGSLLVQLTGETCAGTDDKVDARLAGTQDVVAVHGDLLAVMHLRLLTPANGKGVRLSAADGGKVKVGVLAGSKGPRARHGAGHTASVAGQGLDDSLSSAGAEVAIGEADETGGTVKSPQSDDGVHVVELDELLHLAMVPDTNNGCNGTENVKDLEDLVPGMTQNGVGLDVEKDEADSTNESNQKERAGESLLEDCGESLTLVDRSNPVSQCVCDSLECDNASQPPVEQVEGVKGHVQPCNQGVIASSEKNQGHHVDDGKNTSSITEQIGDGGEVLVKVNVNKAECHIGSEVANQAHKLQPCWQGAHIHGGAEGELAVVTLGAERSILDVLLEEAGLP